MSFKFLHNTQKKVDRNQEQEVSFNSVYRTAAVSSWQTGNRINEM
jgi:hypothetical protein